MSMPMNPSVTLARLPRKGIVRGCPNGCVHVTYCGVTLDFTGSGFEEFARIVAEHRLEGGVRSVEVDCFHVTMRFTSEEYREFAGLVTEGIRSLNSRKTVSNSVAAFDRPRPLRVQESGLSPN